jgi:nicotinate-nucleotide adenylyltransferase
MIGLFGGTFNPVHNGHLLLAQQLMDAYSFQQIDFVPCHLPVHRDRPQVLPEQRKRMVELAIQPYESFRLNSLELERGGDSYTFDTLSEIKNRQPDTVLCWLMGADSFNSFGSWKNPCGILELAHLIVCSRPDVEINGQQWSEYFLHDGDKLDQHSAGKIDFFQMSPSPCNSTQIRQQLKNAESVTGCLALPVLNFIKQNHFYET